MSAPEVVIIDPRRWVPSTSTETDQKFPIARLVSDLPAGVLTFLVTPSSANLAAALTDETGSGPDVFATSPQFTADVGVGVAPSAGYGLKVASPTSQTALGIDNVRLGVSLGLPIAIFEDSASAIQWQLCNLAGTFCIFTPGVLAVVIGVQGGSTGNVVFVGNLTTAPSSNPSGGSFTYVEGGATKVRGSGGTVTTIAAA